MGKLGSREMIAKFLYAVVWVLIIYKRRCRVDYLSQVELAFLFPWRFPCIIKTFHEPYLGGRELRVNYCRFQLYL